jgi:hypothetical protein
MVKLPQLAKEHKHRKFRTGKGLISGIDFIATSYMFFLLTGHVYDCLIWYIRILNPTLRFPHLSMLKVPEDHYAVKTKGDGI